MSVENHPNINAVGLASTILESIVAYSRNNAEGTKALTPIIHKLTIKYVTDVSEALDNQFGVDIHQ